MLKRVAALLGIVVLFLIYVLSQQSAVIDAQRKLIREMAANPACMNVPPLLKAQPVLKPAPKRKPAPSYRSLMRSVGNPERGVA
jgi:hypothetical protein